MLRKLVLLLVAVVVVVVALGAAGFRIQRGGSGWPRFIAHSNDDILEADRARQKSLDAQAPSAGTSSVPAPAVPGSNTAQEAVAPIASTSAPALQTASTSRKAPSGTR